MERFAKALGHHSSFVGGEEIGAKRRRTVDQAGSQQPDINADEVMEDVGEVPLGQKDSKANIIPF